MTVRMVVALAFVFVVVSAVVVAVVRYPLAALAAPFFIAALPPVVEKIAGGPSPPEKEP